MDGSFTPVLVSGRDAHPTDAAWWRGAVIYQVYPRSFCDSNGDGVGDLPGIIAKLDHIASLGVDALWLCPFTSSGHKDFGYDVADYLSVDPLFGTMEDVDLLITEAHARGLRVLFDLVLGHTSAAHSWFLESRHSQANDRADWYVWADPAADGTPPNNWLSVFGGAAWTWEPRRRQYYLHHFLADQPALNLHNPEVVNALIDVARFWLDKGVDGFRLDAIDFYLHDAELRPNTPAASWGGVVPAKLFALQQHVHDMLQPGIPHVLARIRHLLDRYPGTTSLGEVSSQPGAYGRVIAYTTGPTALHMAYTLSPLRGPFTWASVRGLLTEAEAAGTDGWPCWSWSNHDVERAVSRWNPDRSRAPDPHFARLLIWLLISMRGSICLYQGEELGLPDADLAFPDLRDPFGIRYFPEFRGRDGARTPMPWTQDAPAAGFSTAQPWLPVPSPHHGLAVDAQERNSTSLLHEVRAALLFRAENPCLRVGSLHVLDLPEPVVGFERRHGDDSLICLFNLSGASVSVSLDSGTHTLTLGAYGACFLAANQP